MTDYTQEWAAWGKDQILTRMYDDGIITSGQRDYYKLNFAFLEYKRSYFSQLWKKLLNRRNNNEEYIATHVRLMMDAFPERQSIDSDENTSDDTSEELIEDLRNLTGH